MQDCQSTGDIQTKLKRLFAGTIEQMLEAEMDEPWVTTKTALRETTPVTAARRTGAVHRRDGYWKHVCAGAAEVQLDKAFKELSFEMNMFAKVDPEVHAAYKKQVNDFLIKAMQERLGG